MNPLDTSFTVLAGQHAAFLMALGSSFLAMLGIVAALTYKDAKLNTQRNDFLMAAMCLVVVSFIGAHCMAEVAALSEGQAANKDNLSPAQLSYKYASLFLYLSSIGFVEALHNLGRMLESNQVIPRFTKFMQVALAVSVGFYCVISIHLSYEEGYVSDGTTFGQCLTLIVIATLLLLLVLMALSENTFRYKDVPVHLWFQFAFSIVGLGGFMLLYYRANPMPNVTHTFNVFELAALGCFVITSAITSIIPLKEMRLPQKADSREPKTVA